MARRPGAAARKAARRAGVKPLEWERARADLTESFGRPPSDGDILWRVLNTRLIEHPENESMTRFDMALFLFETGRDEWRAALRDAHDVTLARYAARAVEIRAKDCCEPCRSLHGMRASARDFLSRALLPNPDCTRGWCNCSYAPRTRFSD